MADDRFSRIPASAGPFDGKRGPGGNLLCRQCGTEVKPPRKTYCSKACVDAWLLVRSPSAMRREVEKRDRGVCASCGIDTGSIGARVERLENRLRERLWEARRLTGEAAERIERRALRTLTRLARALATMLGVRVRLHDGAWRTRVEWTVPALWEMDHIIPVVEGGGSCGLDNLRTLCRRCHVKETAELARRRAGARRETRA